MKDKIIQENLSMTGILKWLEENHKTKKSGNPFSISDVQGYIMRGNIPVYLGGVIIVEVENKYNKLYKLVSEISAVGYIIDSKDKKGNITGNKLVENNEI